MRRNLFYAALAVCAALAFASCKKDGGGEKQPENHYTYDGVKKPILSAAYYLSFTEERVEKGYNIVFSAQSGVELTPGFDDQSKDLFSIDMPFEKTGAELDFAVDNISGDHWEFYMYRWDAASETLNYFGYNLTSGTIKVYVSADGTFEISVDAVDNDGKMLEVYYKGKPTERDDYIWADWEE